MCIGVCSGIYIYVCHNIRYYPICLCRYLPSQVAFYLQNVHIQPRKIYLTLTCESLKESVVNASEGMYYYCCSGCGHGIIYVVYVVLLYMYNTLLLFPQGVSKCHHQPLLARIKEGIADPLVLKMHPLLWVLAFRSLVNAVYIVMCI